MSVAALRTERGTPLQSPRSQARVAALRRRSTRATSRVWCMSPRPSLGLGSASRCWCCGMTSACPARAPRSPCSRRASSTEVPGRGVSNGTRRGPTTSCEISRRRSPHSAASTRSSGPEIARCRTAFSSRHRHRRGESPRTPLCKAASGAARRSAARYLRYRFRAVRRSRSLRVGGFESVRHGARSSSFAVTRPRC